MISDKWDCHQCTSLLMDCNLWSSNICVKFNISGWTLENLSLQNSKPRAKSNSFVRRDQGSFTQCDFLVNVTAIKMGCVDVNETVLQCDCDAFVCVISHMNGFHTHSVQLLCAIPICFNIDCSHTVWTNSLKSQEKFFKKCRRNVAKDINCTVWTSHQSQLKVFGHLLMIPSFSLAGFPYHNTEIFSARAQKLELRAITYHELFL